MHRKILWVKKLRQCFHSASAASFNFFSLLFVFLRLFILKSEIEADVLNESSLGGFLQCLISQNIINGFPISRESLIIGNENSAANIQQPKEKIHAKVLRSTLNEILVKDFLTFSCVYCVYGFFF